MVPKTFNRLATSSGRDRPDRREYWRPATIDRDQPAESEGREIPSFLIR